MSDLGNTSGTPLMIKTRVKQLLDDPSPIHPEDRVYWYKELSHMLSVAAYKWEKYLTEERTTD